MFEHSMKADFGFVYLMKINKDFMTIELMWPSNAADPTF